MTSGKTLPDAISSYLCVVEDDEGLPIPEATAPGCIPHDAHDTCCTVTADTLRCRTLTDPPAFLKSGFIRPPRGLFSFSRHDRQNLCALLPHQNALSPP